ncbi:hypothetical protein ETD83_03500 [Actinomadura soli]|uniref:PBP domain-containing protein n=1 Tax=Actinomadura soli TaxID=2508997 RepID=A0A5C4JIH5_9ACTN|nr:substrate-binding domain-containing protein [Actinomadura soli]TMR06743.1 hypothetical protein ETD83_03500 [Actinomadura soli]
MGTGFTGRRGRVVLAAGLVCALGPLAPPSTAAAAALPAVNGAGSTFAQIAIQQWTADVSRQFGLRVNYQGNGSTAGRAYFAQKQVDFASSDVSFGFPAGLGNEPRPNFPYTYLPLVAGGTAILANVRDSAGRPITDLQMSGPLATWVFTQPHHGAVHWDDARIAAENPHLRGRLPHTVIRPVVRKGGSGTTSVFTEYLYSQDAGRWRGYMQLAPQADDCTGRICSATDEWPTTRNNLDYKEGSDGVANHVQRYAGTVGYAEYAYALQRGIPVVRIRNAAGNYVLPEACHQAIALTRADRNGDGTYNLQRVYRHPHPRAYPVSSYNYVIVPTSGSDPQKGEAMARFILYSITDGQRKAAALGYSPLPTNLISQGFSALGQVPGRPSIPGNPATWGQFYESLKLPDGTTCGESGKRAQELPVGSRGSGGGSGGGGAGATGAGTPGATTGPTGGPGSLAPGATTGPNGNSSVSPTQAATAASNVADALKKAGQPWLLYATVLVFLALLFLPVPIAEFIRGRRSGDGETE